MSFLVDCPAGYRCQPGFYPMTVIVPEGTICLGVPTAQNAAGGVLRLLGCQCESSRLIPEDATDEEIQELADELFEEWAQQFANCASFGPPVPGVSPPVLIGNPTLLSDEQNRILSDDGGNLLLG
jgi:hypothetical protein